MTSDENTLYCLFSIIDKKTTAFLESLSVSSNPFLLFNVLLFCTGKVHGSDFGATESEDYRTRQPLQMWDYVESKMPGKGFWLKYNITPHIKLNPSRTKWPIRRRLSCFCIVKEIRVFNCP